jgi:Ca-activated chloride channel family protein
MVTLAIALMAVALAGPRFGTKLKEVKREGVDLVVALDVSLSMQARDVAPNRLDRAKNEIKKLLDELRGDRVGLVLFAGDAFVQCPLTTDYGAVRLFLDVANPALIPTPGTDFGAALRRAVQAFQTGGEVDSEEERTRVLLFISDGENHVADIPSVLREARDEGILMFAAGVGETEGSPIPISVSRRNPEYKKDRQGRTVTSRLEEDALKELSSDGAYFRIGRTSSSLAKIIASLERLERTEFGTEEFEEYDEKFQWPLALACILLLGECFVRDHRAES